MGHQVSTFPVADLLHQLSNSLQANRKTVEGKNHPDRDEQFQHISATVKKFQQEGQPVISCDTKKKELASSRARARSGSAKVSPNRSTSTTSPTPNWARSRPTACTISLATTPGECRHRR